MPQHNLTLEQVEADPWLVVKAGKVRYFYPGQPVIWKSQYIGVHKAVVVSPHVYRERHRWKWVTNLGLPEPPSACTIVTAGGQIIVDVCELKTLEEARN